MTKRVIKFRAWDKADKRMMYRGVFDRNWYATPKNDENGCNCIRGISPDDRPQIELMQFTGLLDKNGKEIYEGDVANITLGLIEKGGYTERGEMKWNEKYAQFAFECKDSLFESALKNPFFKIEIIGNIYEHPNLLETT